MTYGVVNFGAVTGGNISGCSKHFEFQKATVKEREIQSQIIIDLCTALH